MRLHHVGIVVRNIEREPRVALINLACVQPLPLSMTPYKKPMCNFGGMPGRSLLSSSNLLPRTRPFEAPLRAAAGLLICVLRSVTFTPPYAMLKAEALS